MKITDLQKRIGRFELNVESLSIEPGRIHGIVGPNGCGKTVFLKLVMGILEPDRGQIDYEGIRPEEEQMDELLCKAGLLEQKKQYARSLSRG